MFVRISNDIGSSRSAGFILSFHAKLICLLLEPLSSPKVNERVLALLADHHPCPLVFRFHVVKAIVGDPRLWSLSVACYSDLVSMDAGHNTRW